MAHSYIIKQGNFLFRYRSYWPFLLLPFYIYYSYVGFIMGHFNPHNITADDRFILWGVFGFLTFGLLLRFYITATTPQGTSGRNTKMQVAASFNHKGFYSILRHPLYFANYIIFLGCIMLLQSVSAIIIGSLLYWIYYIRIMAAEEDFLGRKFGKSYRQWAKSTPIFIPKLSAWQSPNVFSFKRILFKEGSSILSTFIIMPLFFIINDILWWHNSWQELMEVRGLWMLIGIGGIITYAILKFLRKRTTLLHA